jgi:hypothetical protein
MLIYLAHPVSGDVAGNLESCRAIMLDLMGRYPHHAFVAPWITYCEILDDDDPEQRARGMRDDLVVLARCDQIWLVGPHVSAGMIAEKEIAENAGLWVVDMTRGGR